MSANMSHVIDCVRRGEIGVFPAKNGYMLVGSGAVELYRRTCAKIRRAKQKTVARPLARVASSASILRIVEQYAPHAATTVERHIEKPIIWSVTTTDYPEDTHDIPEVGFAPYLSSDEQELIEALVTPLIASSANISGFDTTPHEVASISTKILTAASFVFDQGPLIPQPDYAVIHVPDFSVYRSSPVVSEVM